MKACCGVLDFHIPSADTKPAVQTPCYIPKLRNRSGDVERMLDEIYEDPCDDVGARPVKRADCLYQSAKVRLDGLLARYVC